MKFYSAGLANHNTLNDQLEKHRPVLGNRRPMVEKVLKKYSKS